MAIAMYESDTASEEESPMDTTGKSSTKHSIDSHSDTASEDNSPGKSSASSPTVIATPKSIPQKGKIKSRIGCRKRESQDLPDDPALHPSKRVHRSATPEKSPIAETSSEPVKSVTRIFHHTGKKNYFLEDAPLDLTPYSTSQAIGGFGVRVVQKGTFVGLIVAGEEKECRKLLSEGWKAELRYLGGGKSEILMRRKTEA